MSSYHHGNLREALIEEASELLVEVGLSGLTLREAARRAGVSPGAPYRHFPDKESLLAELAVRGFQRLGSELLDTAGRFAEPTERLAQIGNTYILFALAHRALHRLMFGGYFDDALHPEVKNASRAAFVPVKVAIEDLVSSRGLPTDDTSALELATWSFVHGFASLILNGQVHDEETTPEFILALTRKMARWITGGFGNP